MSPSLPAVELSAVTQHYGRTAALIDVDLNLTAGRRHALVGPNGSGKTTLLRLLAGLLRPSRGSAHCLGLDLRTHARLLKNRIAYVTQHFSLYEELTLDENLRFIAGLYAVSRESAATAAIIESFDLRSVRSQRAAAVSVGVRQRLMLAAALMRQPKLLLLDEPTAALDTESRTALWRCIDECQAAGTTVVLTTHDRNDFDRCDTLTHLADGRITTHRAVRLP